jgi:hypothetical protein
LILSNELEQKLDLVLEPIDLQTLGYILFRCGPEEQSEYGRGPYNIPGFGDVSLFRLWKDFVKREKILSDEASEITKNIKIITKLG